jgi:hypothetical protein
MGIEIRRFSVEVFGQTMLMHGQVGTTRRLTDHVNEMGPYLDIAEVSTFPYAADTVPGVETQGHGLVNKASMVMLAEMDGHQPPVAIPAAAEMRVPKAAHRILVYTNQFAINADIHLSAGVELTNFLTVSPGRFVPVTNATVLPLQTGTQLTTFHRSFLLINREQIMYLGASPESTVPAAVPDGDAIG